jgi:stage III sporulation protein AD
MTTDVVRLSLFVAAALVFVVLLKQVRPELALPAGLAALVVLAVEIVSGFWGIAGALSDLASRARIDLYYFDVTVRVMVIAYVADLTAQACRDADQAALGAQVDMAGKVLIIALALPVVRAVLGIAERLLGQGNH